MSICVEKLLRDIVIHKEAKINIIKVPLYKKRFSDENTSSEMKQFIT